MDSIDSATSFGLWLGLSHGFDLVFYLIGAASGVAIALALLFALFWIAICIFGGIGGLFTDYTICRRKNDDPFESPLTNGLIWPSPAGTTDVVEKPASDPVSVPEPDAELDIPPRPKDASTPPVSPFFPTDELSPVPTIRKTLAKPVTIIYTHKKQTGGSGQYAEVKIEFEPGASNTGIVFGSAILGHNVPAEYIPGVEKGVYYIAAENGLTDFNATLVDGKYHDVDSSILAFEIAGRFAVKKAIDEAGTTITTVL